MIGLGVLVGVGAAFTGLGGGFLMVPLLLMMGYTAHKAVGTYFLAILVLSISTLIAHNKLANVDFRAGLLLGIGALSGHRSAPGSSSMYQRPASKESLRWCWWDRPCIFF